MKTIKQKFKKLLSSTKTGFHITYYYVNKRKNTTRVGHL